MRDFELYLYYSTIPAHTGVQTWTYSQTNSQRPSGVLGMLCSMRGWILGRELLRLLFWVVSMLGVGMCLFSLAPRERGAMTLATKKCYPRGFVQ
jgi:hypothetical protein